MLGNILSLKFKTRLQIAMFAPNVGERGELCGTILMLFEKKY